MNGLIAARVCFIFFIVLIPPVIMYGLGRVCFGPNSRDVISQMGYAITLESFLYAIYRKTSKGSDCWWFSFIIFFA